MPRRSLSTAKGKSVPVLSPYEQFKERWKGGCGSGLCDGARNKVFARGTVPCDILFVGEAPGESEDVCAKPFIGPAGNLLDVIVERALGPRESCPYSVCFTNVVCCIPRDDDGDKVSEPADEDVKACMPRLQEFVRLCDPKLIIAVGTMARDWLDRKRRDHVPLHRDIPVVDILHPAYILRSNVAQRGLLVQRTVVTISTAIEDYLEG